jgi:hypothetical protein
MKEEPYDAEVKYLIQLTTPSTLRDVKEEDTSLIIGVIKEEIR